MPKSSTQNFNDKHGDFKLPSWFKSLSPNIHLLHLSVLRQLNNQRAGTASTKTRAEVRGGGKKPWKQKGTGRARVGSIRSPLWVGGGIIFGPKPRKYEIDLPKKVRSLAVAQALAAKVNNIVILKGLPDLKHIKTKEFKAAIKSMNLSKVPVLLIASLNESGFLKAEKASNNLQDVLVREQRYVGVFEILKANTIGITESAMNELDKRLSKSLKAKGASTVA